jgi:hypothetical protein
VRRLLWLVGFGTVLFGFPPFGGAILLMLPLASVAVHVYLGRMSGREIQRQMIEAEQRREGSVLGGVCHAAPSCPDVVDSSQRRTKPADHL